MCFSATASFGLAAALVPAGLICLGGARVMGSRWLGLAVYPFGFAVQQAFEGGVWLGLQHDMPQLVQKCASGFLFFSHLFWLVWVPVSVYWLQRGTPLAPWLMALIAAGAALGTVLFLPVLGLSGPIPVSTQPGSIDYQVPLLLGGENVRYALKLAYFAVVVASLSLSTDRRIQGFAALIAASLVVTEVWFSAAFISVWCYFAAVLSLYLAALFWWETRRNSLRPIEPGQR